MKAPKLLVLSMLFVSCRLPAANAPAGYVVGWGHNYRGVVTGVPSPSDEVTGVIRTGVVAIDGQELSSAVAISAADEHCLALRSDGTVVAWGSNRHGQTSVLEGLSNVVRIATEGAYNVAIKSDRTGISWGLDQPPEENDLTNVIAASYYEALRADGRLVSRGRTNMDNHQTFVPAGLSNVVDFAHYGDGLALKSDGTVAEWTPSGQIPIEYHPTEWTNGRVIGYRIQSADYKVIDGLSNAVAIAACGSHNFALKSDGTVFGWGFNEFGDATGVVETNSPLTWGNYVMEGWSSQGLVRIDGQVLSNVVSIASGAYINMALKNDGTIVRWGGSPHDGMDVPTGLSNVVAIAIGQRGGFCLAITTNRAVAEKFRQK
jgi:alpha-tubulin suppressor-like RCC1 family protein